MSRMPRVLRLHHENAPTRCLNRNEEKDMKYILMMNGTKASFAEYAKWSKKDMEANVAFMRVFSKQLKDDGVFVATEGLGWPDQAKLVRAGKDGVPITDGI